MENIPPNTQHELKIEVLVDAGNGDEAYPPDNVYIYTFYAEEPTLTFLPLIKR